MRRLELPSDQAHGEVTYDLGDGRFVRFDAIELQEHGLESLLRFHGLAVPTGHVKLMQRGRLVGAVPATFDPLAIKPGLLYAYRTGDYVRKADHWEAADSLGSGDFKYIDGFVPANDVRVLATFDKRLSDDELKDLTK